MGNYDVAKYLIESGASIHTTVGSLLIEAIASPTDEETKCKFVELLCSSGVDINSKNRMGQRALQVAAYLNCTELVKLLVQKGAHVIDAESRKPVFESELFFKSSDGTPEMLELLLQISPNVTAGIRNDWLSFNLFGLVFNEWDTDVKKRMIKMFTDKGARLDVEDEEGVTLLHAACGRASESWPYNLDALSGEIVHYLLENDADVHAVLEDGRTPLHVLCGEDLRDGPDEGNSRNVLDCVKALLAHGADVDLRDDNGDSPLELAVQAGKSEVIDLLLAHEKPNLPDYA
jgi:ankyrin repeat protein